MLAMTSHQVHSGSDLLAELAIGIGLQHPNSSPLASGVPSRLMCLVEEEQKGQAHPRRSSCHPSARNKTIAVKAEFFPISLTPPG